MGFFAAPTPMMAVVLVCVVETGKPPKVASIRLTNVERLAANPWNASSFTMSMPTDLMMRAPPTAVPRPMLKAQKIMSHMGIATPDRSMPMPAGIIMASMKMDMNFWPSWAPCMKATPAPEHICAHLKNEFAF